MNNKKIIHVLVFFSVLFLSLITYLTVIEVIYRDDYVSNSFNTRNSAKEFNIIRGRILDRKGEVLAYSKIEDDVHKRYYPYENLYSHVIGYCSPIYGKSLLETSYNSELLGEEIITSFFNFRDSFSGEKKKGNDLVLTIDHNLQKRASNLLGNRSGAVIASNPKTGEILAMVSKPDFNPNQTYLASNWESLSQKESAPLLARATMGLYAPGSTYKIVTASALIENGMDDLTVSDNGSITIGDHTIKNAGGAYHGDLGIEDAFRLSSNVYFASAGVKLKTTRMRTVAENFLINKKIGFDISYNKSRFASGSFTKSENAITAIGQGRLLVSPLQMNLITCAIANGGNIIKPHLMKKITTNNGFTVRSAKKETLTRAVSEECADTIKDYMLKVVENGTGTAARISGVKVCGKTGTAENEKTDANPNATHAWFTCFAPYDDPEIAVTVMIEYGGSGGGVAAPIAREIIRSYLGR